jgi:thymidine kinase
MARLEIIIGNMFSGKSTELIRRLKRHQAIGTPILVINSAKDVRSENEVLQTHDKSTLKCIKTNSLKTVDVPEYIKVIGIDECQFFTGLRDFVKICLDRDINVVLAGLDGDFMQQTFGELLSLVPLADQVIKLSALCMECLDGTPGPFTKRTVDSNEQELIGAAECYKAVCRRHLVYYEE